MKSIFLLFCSVFALAVYSYAGDLTWVKKTQITNLYNGQYSIFENQRVSGEDTRIYNKLRGFVRLNYTRKDQSDRTHQYNWNLRVDYTYLVNGVVTPGTLTINNEPSGRIYEDYQEIQLPNGPIGYSITVTNVSASYTPLSGGNSTVVSAPQTSIFIPDDIDLVLELRSERTYNLNTAAVMDDISRVSFSANDFKLYWNYQQGAEEYDLEWVFIDKYSLEYQQVITAENNYSANELAGFTLPFELVEPTRVRVWGFNYQLDRVYPEGRLYFRVRAVNNFGDQTNGISDNIRTGKWGYFIPSSSSNLVLCKYEITEAYQFETNKTWLYGISYADDGKSVSTLTYYDGSNRGRQNLTYNTSDDVTLVGESKYDNEGRQTVSVIPGPIMGRNLMYRPNFNMALNNSIFDEGEIEEDEILPLSATSGSARYFSKNNDFTNDLFRDAIPNANGYVFSQTIFRNDGTGRVERAGGIGTNFQATGDHAVRTWYGSTNVAELKRLFGDNVDHVPQGYRKDMVEDANDQLSVTYYDKRGNVIATALAGNAPEELRKLDYTEQLIRTPLNDNNVRIGNSMISEHTFLNTVPNSAISLQYGLEGFYEAFANQSVEVEGHEITFDSLCPDCIYILKIEVKDQDGEHVAGSPIQQAIQAGTCADEIDYEGPLNNFTLSEIGEYRIIKTLTVDEASMIAAFEEQLSEQHDSAYADFLGQYMENIDLTACFEDCESMCMYSVKMDFIQQNGQAAWDALVPEKISAMLENCIEVECDIDNHDTEQEPLMEVDADAACSAQRQRMIHQISPGGVFYDDHSSTFWNNVPANITIGGTSYSKAELQNPEIYTNQMANALLMFHREVCMQDEQKCHDWMSLQNASLHMTGEILSATWGTGSIWTAPYSADPTTTAFGINFYNHIKNKVDNYLSDNQVIGGGTPVINGVNCPGAGGSSPTNGNLRDYVEFIGNKVAAGEDCAGSPLTAAQIIELKKQLFSGIYLHIKWTLVKQLSPCDYFDDANAIYLIPNDQYAMNQVIEDVLGTPSNQYCDQKAIEAVNIWMSGLSSSCLASLGFGSFTPLVYGTPPAMQYASSYDPQATNLDLPHLFYTYARATCSNTNASNSLGLFYDPDVEEHPGLQPGEAQYDAIIALLAGTGCNYGPGNPIQFEIDPPLFSYNTGGAVVATNLFDLKNGLNHLINYTNPLFSIHYPDMLVNHPFWGWQDRTITVSNLNIPGVGTGNINYRIRWNPKSPVFLTRWFEHYITYNINIKGCVYSGQINFMSRFPQVNANQLAFALTGGNNLPLNVSYFYYANFRSNESPVYIRATRPIHKSCPPDAGSTYAVGFSPSSWVMNEWGDITNNLQNDCIESQYNQAEADAQVLYNQVIEQLWSNFYEKMNTCLDVTEKFNMIYTLKEYQYTLYYYDLAGNLVQTVPPQGVHPFDQNGIDSCLNGPGRVLFPPHDMETRYVYNGLNALVTSFTPDGGKTDLYLDKLYRVRFSQTAQQAQAFKASYANYDELGRVVEAGEFRKGNTDDLSVWANNPSYPVVGMIMDYTHTFYESGYVPPATAAGYPAYPSTIVPDNTLTLAFGTEGQQNLRNSIGAVMHRQGDFSSTGILVAGTEVISVISYSYDAHKNVKKMVSTNNYLAGMDQQHKSVDYRYDLISGNVEEVIYQRGAVDEYRHRYSYDANNRLTRSYTSHNGDFWELDAKYFYYLHGSLARRELGHDQVQGTDYAYNLQGWLKGVNSTTLDRTRDIGKDGNLGTDNKYFGTDAYGFSLGYFDWDYQAIKDAAETSQNSLNDYFATSVDAAAVNENPDPHATGHPMSSLYNGNITHMVTAMTGTNEQKLDILLNNYQYDQLHRIRQMKVYHDVNIQATNFISEGAALYRSGGTTESAFQESYTFDKNGNLRTLKRNGSGWKDLNSNGIFDSGEGIALAMDNFTYNYYTQPGTGITTDPTKTNQLRSVSDNVAIANYTGDIDPGQGTSANYVYNASGQLTKDLDEDIFEIKWTATGKVKKITYTDAGKTAGKRDVKFIYDPMDRRIAKMVYKDNNSWIEWTHYSYDASGNVLASYTRNRKLTGWDANYYYYSDSYVLDDHTIYGASRLGIEQENLTLYSKGFKQLPSAYNPDVELAFKWQSNPPDLALPIPDYTQRVVGDKRYELSNHLGNVLEVITDRKLGVNVVTVAPTITGLTGASNNSGVITRTVTGSGWGTSGGASVQTLVQGDQVEWRLGGAAAANNQYIVVGLSAANPNNQATSITYGWYTHANGLTVLESGVPPAGQTYGTFGAYLPGDVLKIVRDNGQLLYYHNGVVKYSRVDPQPNTALLVDFSFYEYNRSIYDLKIIKNSTTTVYTADVVSYSDYSPYGTLLDMRHGNDDTYRYGFQGQERDDEIKGAGNSYNYEYRMHDPRIGRFFAIDPLAPKYPWYTPYQFSGNKVISHVELEGLEEKALTPSGGSMNLPSGAKILKRYDNTSDGYVGPAVGAYSNYQGPVSAYNGGENETMFAVDGSVESFDYLGKTYKAVFSSGSGIFSGYESTDNLTEGGYTKSTPTISYGSGKVILSQDWGVTAPSGSQVATAGLIGSASLGDTPLGWVVGGAFATGAVIAGSIELQSQTWNFDLTDAPAVPISTTTTYDKDLFTIIYRNIGQNEYNQLINGGYNFALGTSKHSMIVKQFWLDPTGLANWNTTDWSKQYNVSILVPKSIIGPGNILNTSTQVDIHLGRSATIDSQIDLNIFNKVKTVLSITPAP